MSQFTEKELNDLSIVMKNKIEDGIEAAMRKYQAELDKMQAAGIAADDDRVRDIEKRMAEAEHTHAENLNETIQVHKEEIRQLKNEIAQARGAAEILHEDMRPGDRGYKPDYKGCFIPNIDQMREFVRAQSGYYGPPMGRMAPPMPIAPLGAPRAQGMVRATDLTSAMLTASTGQGLLPPDVADTFIDNLVSQQAALSRVTTRRMNSPTAYIDELHIAARTMRLGAEGVAGSNSQAFAATRRTMTTTEVLWTEDITLSFLEDNIEKRGAEAHVANMIATAMGNDLNDLAWNGDSTTASFLIINDGWRKIITAATGTYAEVTYTATTNTSATQVLSGMLKVLPVAMMGRTDVGYFVSIPFAQHFADEVAVRETSLGDSVTVNGFPALRYFGRPVVPDPHLSSAASSNAHAVLTAFPNLVFGVQRQITVDAQWQARTRVIEYTVSARIDYEVASPDMIVQTVTIPSALQ